MAKSTSFDTLGKTYRGFTVTKAQPVPELQCTLRELTHKATGAHVIHIANDDAENLFCLSFQTRPARSDGVAHILEHTVLCGSDKFPVKDPFFAMTRRSLNTFMNALTGADFTCYPAATQITKDFYNLLDVYLDAVFKPRLLDLSFRQEGHRLEFQKADDPKTGLEYKGVVFNEMKGALTSPTARLGEAISASLFPDLTYGCNSGGDPKVIPELTYEQLKEFHGQYYHPSRCLFFFYGNMPLEPHLDFIAEHCLETSDKQAPLPPIPRQKRFKKPVYRTLTYPATGEDGEDEKTYVALAWLTCHILEQEELLALNVLDTALMDTDASPLRMALLKSGLCKQANSSMDNEVSEIPWILTMRGCNLGDADKLEKIARDKLLQIAEEGIPPNLIDSAIHQLEFHRSEITGDTAPFGLSLFWRSALLSQHGGLPEDGLIIHSLFKRLRQRIAEDATYLPSLIRKYLLDNPHFVRVVMTPDKELAAHELAEERAKLDKIRKGLKPAQVEGLVDDAAALTEFHRLQEEQDLDVLPTLTLSDVPPKARDYLLQREKVGKLQTYHHACFTNQIVYVDLVLNFPQLQSEQMPYVRLLSRLLSEMGSGGRDYQASLEYMQEHTGGVDAALNLNMQADPVGAFHPALHLRGKALYRKGERLFSFIRDIATSADLSDRARLKEVVQKQYTSLEGALNSNAMRYAINLSASALDSAGRLGSLWYGLEYLSMVRDLAQNFDKRVDGLVEQLEYLQGRLLHLKDMDLVISCDESYYQKVRDEGFYGLSDLAGKAFEPWKTDLKPLDVVSQGRLIAAPVAFTAKVCPAVGYCDPDAAPLGLAAHLMDNKTLHGLVREKGGAYGGGAANNPMNAHFYFFSYRDPHLTETLKAFETAVNDLLKGNFDDEDLEAAKLESVQDLDAPVAPGSRAALSYGWLRAGKTLAIRQRNRERILKATREDVMAAVKRTVLPNLTKGATVTFAGQELLERENKKFKEMGQTPFKIEKV